MPKQAVPCAHLYKYSQILALVTDTGSAAAAYCHCQALPEEAGRHARTGSERAQSSHTGNHSNLSVLLASLRLTLKTLSCDLASLRTRTATIQTCVTEVTSTGACCPPIRRPPRRWCLPRSPSSRRRRTCWSRHYWMSLFVTFPLWPQCTTSHQAPSWREKYP